MMFSIVSTSLKLIVLFDFHFGLVYFEVLHCLYSSERLLILSRAYFGFVPM